MKRILVISGSRADYGLLEWPVKVLSESFEVDFVQLHAKWPDQAFVQAQIRLEDSKPDCLLILGDRWEILQAAIAAHLQRIPIAHLCGGDKTPYSYDDAMRECISLMAKWHFVTSPDAATNLRYLLTYSESVQNIHMVGNIATDYIKSEQWKGKKPFDFDYVVVSYQPETIDNTVDLAPVWQAIGDRSPIWITPNPDLGSDRIPPGISLPHDEFVNLLYHSTEFIGNSSAMLYEAPALGVKCTMIGRRQMFRPIPTDGIGAERKNQGGLMSVLVIAEIGVNHNGDVKLARDMVHAAKDAGADIAKLQLFKDRPEIEHLRLTEDDLLILHDVCGLVGIEFACTPFYTEAIRFLNPLVSRHKVASGWLDNELFMNEIWASGKPVIISTGKSSIANLLQAPMIHHRTSLLHCVSLYPCPDEKADLEKILELQFNFDTSPIGYSDHTTGITACLCAVALGAKIIEKHFTFDKTQTGPDHSCSAEPHEFADMVKQIRRLEKML